MPYQQYNFKPQTFDAQKKQPDLRLLYISHSSYDKTWPSVLHSHPFTELFYVLNGTAHSRPRHKPSALRQMT